MKESTWKFMAALVAIMLMAGVMPSVYAQEDEEEDSFTLEEITVTAQKREENQQKVPIAMEVISGEDIATLGRNNVDEILKNVSNILINTTSDGQRISLRGITDDSLSSSNQHVAESVVGMNVDGSYSNQINSGQDLFDIERVEVLFGPQSTMYGSNAPAGIVNVITASPKTDRYSASASVEYGSYDLLNLQAVLNVPVLKEKIALRAAANRSEQGSYVGADAKSETTSVRLRALYEANEDLSFSLTGNWSKRSNGGQTGGSVIPFADQDDDTYPDGTPLTDPWTSTGADDEGGNVFDQITKGVSGNFDWSMGLGTISLVPSYSESSSDGHGTRAAGGGGPGGGAPPGPPPGMSVISTDAIGSIGMQITEEEEEELIGYWQEDKNVQEGVELRMTNNPNFEWFEWILGGSYFNSEQSRESILEDEANTYSLSETIQKQTAAYANITYPLWFYKKFALTLGYRQSWAKNYLTEIGTGRSAETRGNEDGYSEPDFSYGFEYNFADNLMFYGSFASSYRQPSAAGGGGPNMESRAEELDSYQAGMKSRWLNNRLQVNLSAFYYDYANKLQSGFKVWENITEEDIGFIDNNDNGIFDAGDEDYMSLEDDGRGGYTAVAEGDGVYPTEDPDNPGEAYVFTANEPTAQGFGAFESIGVDLQITWVITSRDRLNYSVSYLKSEWKDLHFDYTWDMIWPDEDYYGITPVNSPEWSMTASYQHTFTLGSFGTLVPMIDAQYKSDYTLLWDVMDEEEAACGYQEAYVLWDASASFNHSSGKWSLSAYVKNITNYAVKRSYHGMTDNREMRLGDPRTYAGSFSIKF